VTREQMISSNMAAPRLLCNIRALLLRKTRRKWSRRLVLSLGTGIRFGVCDLLDRSCDAAQRCAEIGDIDHGKQQSCYPEQVDVREERQQAQNGHDLELQFLRLVRHALREAMQSQIERSDPDEGSNQKNAHHHHQDIGPAPRSEVEG